MIKQGWTVKMAGAAAAFALAGAMAFAQNGQYDDQHWGNGPNGYGDAYHEQQGRPMYGARQGWTAGFAQGQADKEHGHSFRPTQVNTYKHVPDSPQGYPRDQFKQEYRDAFVKGYSHGYGRG